MSKVVTVFGATGFLGRSVVRLLAKSGWRVRAAVRDPNLALFLKPYGSVGQIELVPCNLRDEASTARALQGAEAVINCAGVFEPRRKNTFEAINHEAVARIGRLAAAAGVSALVHVSALGQGRSQFVQSKAAGEVALRAAFAGAVVLRPAVMFGKGDGFFNRLAGLTTCGPIVPLLAPESLLQPVWVEDVAEVAVAALAPAHRGKTYSLVGPEAKSLHLWMEDVLEIVRRRRLILPLPAPLGRAVVALGMIPRKLSLGALALPLTPDQLVFLQEAGLAPATSAGFEAFGRTPVAAGIVLPDYLWRFRPSGQFSDIRESAKDLRKI